MNPDKRIIIDDLTARVNASPFLIVVDYTAITVPEFTNLRSALAASGAQCHVAKNNFMRTALTDAGLPDIGEHLVGQTAFITGASDVAGAAKAINTFNPDKNIKLATYASRCIENEILMYLRRNNKTKLEVSIDEPLNVDWDGNELLLSDILGTEEDTIYRDMETEAEHKLLGKAIGRLSNRERVIVQMRFGLGTPDGEEKTQKEVADLLGISQSYISRLEKKIMQRLRREMVRYEQ